MDVDKKIVVKKKKIKDNIINIYSHISERDENNNIYRDWMHHYKIYKNDVKDINRIGGDDANVLLY